MTFKRGDVVKNVAGVRGGLVVTAELAVVWEGGQGHLEPTGYYWTHWMGFDARTLHKMSERDLEIDMDPYP